MIFEVQPSVHIMLRNFYLFMTKKDKAQEQEKPNFFDSTQKQIYLIYSSSS